MFGITTFSQAPFSTLGGNTFAVSISESVAVSDTEAATVAFAADISETVAGSDSQTAQFDVLAVQMKALVGKGDLAEAEPGVAAVGARGRGQRDRPGGPDGRGPGQLRQGSRDWRTHTSAQSGIRVSA